jgi:hypothetical protein
MLRMKSCLSYIDVLCAVIISIKSVLNNERRSGNEELDRAYTLNASGNKTFDFDVLPQKRDKILGLLTSLLHTKAGQMDR